MWLWSSNNKYFVNNHDLKYRNEWSLLCWFSKKFDLNKDRYIKSGNSNCLFRLSNFQNPILSLLFPRNRARTSLHSSFWNFCRVPSALFTLFRMFFHLMDVRSRWFTLLQTWFLPKVFFSIFKSLWSYDSTLIIIFHADSTWVLSWISPKTLSYDFLTSLCL